MFTAVLTFPLRAFLNTFKILLIRAYKNNTIHKKYKRKTSTDTTLVVHIHLHV